MNDPLATADGAPSSDPLYDLLPAIFRQGDMDQGYPLAALFAVFDHVRGTLGAGITASEAAWFIETCPLDRVPLIGRLVGVDIASPVRPEHRALVADTLALRRRKGIAAALPRLVRDTTGWSAIYAPNRMTPPASWPIDGMAMTPGLLLPGGPEAPRSVGSLRVWRLPVFAVTDATPAVSASDPTRFFFDPFGLARPLFTIPAAPIGWDAAPPIAALPVPLTATMLARDLARSAADSLLYGADRGLVIRTRKAPGDAWVALAADRLRVQATHADGPPAPDYPVLRGGDLAATRGTGSKVGYLLRFGDATALLTVAIPSSASLDALAVALRAAIAAADVVPGRIVSRSAVAAITVGVAGAALVLIPTIAANAPFSIAPATVGGPDPLLLVGHARLGIAGATLPIDAEMLAALATAPANTALLFSTPAGQAWSVPLPIVAGDPGQVARAFAAALPTCSVSVAGRRVVIVPPSPTGVVPPPRAPGPLARMLGLAPAVTIDPATGSFVWPSAWPLPAAFSVDHGAAMPAAIGGLGPRPPVVAPCDGVVIDDAGDTTALATQLVLWQAAKAPATMLVLQGSATRSLGAQALAPLAGQGLWITSAAQARPALRLATPGTLTLTGAATTGTIALAGLALQGDIRLGGGALRLALDDTTLVPPPPPPPKPSDPPSPAGPAIGAVEKPAGGDAAVSIARGIVGPIDLTRLTGSIAVSDSVVSVLPDPDPATILLVAPSDVTVDLARTTLLGGMVVAGSLHAVDTLVVGRATCSGPVTLRDSYVVDLTILPPLGDSPPPPPAADVTSAASILRCTRCDRPRALHLRRCLVQGLTVDLGAGARCTCPPDTPTAARDCGACVDPVCATSCVLRAAGQSWQGVGAVPDFVVPGGYPQPGFARLSVANPPEILGGASNRDEIGAYNRAMPTTRGDQLAAALRDSLLYGVSLEVVFET